MIAKCLAKEADARWQSAADIASELEWISGSPAIEIARPQRGLGASIAMAALAVAAAAAVGTSIWFARRLQVAERPIRAELNVPAATPLTPSNAGPIALSPDATRVALLIGGSGANVAGANCIAIRDLASGSLRPLAGTEGATFPFWSPDGKRVGFFANGKLKTISVDGGPIDVLSDAKSGRGGSWNHAGVIVFAPTPVGPIFKIDQAGGTPVAVTKPANATTTNRNPTFLPDGKTFLYINRDFGQIPIGGSSGGALYAGFLDGRPPKRIADNASNAAVVGKRLFFVRNRNLVVQAFDSSALALTGTPFDLAEGLAYWNGFDVGDFSAAGNMIAYVPANARRAQIGVFDSSGRLLDVKGQPGDYSILDVSPDGRSVAVAVTEQSGTDVWILQLDRGILSRVTFTNTSMTAAFSPDGKRIATSTLLKASIQALDGSSAEEIFDNHGLLGVSGWSADGRDLIDIFNVAYVDLQRHKLVPVTNTPAPSNSGALSPNGKVLAYSSLESGRAEVYVTEFPSGHGKWQASVDGGSLPRWSPDGKRLFFVRGGNLFVVDVNDTNGLQFAVPKAVPISVPLANTAVVANYAVTRDGKIISWRT